MILLRDPNCVKNGGDSDMLTSKKDQSDHTIKVASMSKGAFVFQSPLY